MNPLVLFGLCGMGPFSFLGNRKRSLDPPVRPRPFVSVFDPPLFWVDDEGFIRYRGEQP